MIFRLFLLLIFSSILCSCQSQQDTNLTNDNLEQYIAEQSQSQIRQRAQQLMLHFWDGLDYSDTVVCRNKDYIEQNFSNFISLFPLIDSDTRAQAVANMLSGAEKDSVTYGMMARLARHYLYDPNSPMYNEEYYISFLYPLSESSMVTDAEKDRVNWELEASLKNRVGTIGNDFEIITRSGQRQLLSQAVSKATTLVVFYDPNCENCKGIINALANDADVNNSIRQGTLQVLAVYSEVDFDLWQQSKELLPANWQVAMTATNIQDADLYILRAMPSLYLFAPNLQVLLKDCTIPQFKSRFS